MIAQPQCVGARITNKKSVVREADGRSNFLLGLLFFSVRFTDLDLHSLPPQRQIAGYFQSSANADWAITTFLCKLVPNPPVR